MCEKINPKAPNTVGSIKIIEVSRYLHIHKNNLVFELLGFLENEVK